MNDDVLREFLVGLGFKVDEVGMKKFVDSVDKVTKDVKTAGLAIAATATGFIAGVAIISNQMEKLYYASQRTDETVGNIMALRYAAGQIGLTADQAQGALEGFARTLRLNPGTNNLLSSLGVTGNTPAAKFDSFIEQMEKQKPYVAAAYAGLFGIDPDTLLMLENGLPKLEAEQEKYKRRLGAFGINGDQAAEAAKNFNNTIRQATSDFDLLWIVIQSKLTPVLTPLIDQFERWAELHAGEYAQAIADAVKSLANWLQSVDWKKVGDDINGVYNALGGVKGILIGLAAIELAPLVASVLGLAGALTGLGAAGAAATGVGLAGLLGTLSGLGLLGFGGYEAIKAMKDSSPGGHYVPRYGSARPSGGDAPAHDWGETWEGIKKAFDYGGSGHFVSRTDSNSHGSTSGSVYDPSISDTSGVSGVSSGPTNTSKLFASLEKSFALSAGTLDKVWNIESGRGTNMLSPAGAKGHFQFMDDTAKQYGVSDPNDLVQSATGAAKYLHDLLSKYNGDMMKSLAAYNWGSGNLDKDIDGYLDKRGAWHQGHGADWANYLPQETAGYLRKFSGTRLGSNGGLGSNAPVSITQENTFHIDGSADPQGTARAIGNEQSRVNGDLVRNFSGAFH